MFYIEKVIGDPIKAALGTKEFEHIIRRYKLCTGELTPTQLQTFIGILTVLDLHEELVSNRYSHYVVGFSLHE